MGGHHLGDEFVPAYRFAVRVQGAGVDRGEVLQIVDAFTTLAKAGRFIGTYTPENGSTVGVGMPVSFTFDKAITDKKAVESGIEVSSSSGQQVVGHWFGARRLDFRPQEYREAGWRPPRSSGCPRCDPTAGCTSLP